VEGDESACGVWFVNQGDGSRTKIAEHLGSNRSNELLGLIPPLPAGTYRLEVVTQFAGSGVLLKEPRTVKGESELTVA
jgi:hypothetical protein